MGPEPFRYADERARVCLTELVSDLCHLHKTRDRIEEEMVALADRFRSTIRRSGLVYRIKRKRRDLPALMISWCGLSRPMKNDYELTHSEAKRPTRFKYLKGPLNDRMIYTYARQIKNRKPFYAFEDRGVPLNDAVRMLADTDAFLNRSLTLLARPLPNEPQPPPVPLDLTQPAIPPRARRAIEHAWRVLYRIGLVEAELVAIADRWRHDPPHPSYELVFRRDASSPWGRLYWHDLPHDRYLGPLTDRALRRLGVPESQRKKIAPHEIRRRRVTRLHQRFTKRLTRIKQRMEWAIAFAFRQLEESRAFALPATLADLQWQAVDPYHPDEPVVTPTPPAPPAPPEKEAS